MRTMRHSRSPSLFGFLVLVCGGVAFVVVQACSSDEARTDAPPGETPETGTGGGEDGASRDSASITDAPVGDALEDSACAQPVPDLDGGGACGTLEFGEAAQPFGPVDGGEPFTGGYLPPGVYDAVLAERASGGRGSWRETFVVDGAGHFTRIRQVDTGISDASLGPVTRRSGTYSLTDAGTIRLVPTCATSGGNTVDAGTDELPYDVAGDPCGKPSYRYGATGVRITLRRR